MVRLSAGQTGVVTSGRGIRRVNSMEVVCPMGGRVSKILFHAGGPLGFLVTPSGVAGESALLPSPPIVPLGSS